MDTEEVTVSDDLVDELGDILTAPADQNDDNTV